MNMDATREKTLATFDGIFQEHGFKSTPPGLRHLLARLSPNPGESAEQARRRFYRRVFGILWFGNKVGQGQFRGKSLPTYVYPRGLKNVVREILDANLKYYPDSEGAAVYHVTIQDLVAAKWPAVH